MSIEYFRFEAIPERVGYTLGEPPFFGTPMFRIEVTYGGKRNHIVIPAYTEDIMVTESYLEHLIRRAVDAFRQLASDEAKKQKQAEIDRYRERVDASIDELLKKANQ